MAAPAARPMPAATQLRLRASEASIDANAITPATPATMAVFTIGLIVFSIVSCARMFADGTQSAPAPNGRELPDQRGLQTAGSSHKGDQTAKAVRKIQPAK